MGLWSDYEKFVTEMNNDDSEYVGLGFKWFGIAGTAIGALLGIIWGYQAFGIGGALVIGAIVTAVGGIAGLLLWTIVMGLFRLSLVALPIAVVVFVIVALWGVRF